MGSMQVRKMRPHAAGDSVPTALPRLLGGPVMLPERMRARRAPSGGLAWGPAIVAAHGPVVAAANPGARITPRHVDPAPAAAFALNSAKADTGLLCCCGARVGKGDNREKTDGQQITHGICPSVDGLRYLFSANLESCRRHQTCACRPQSVTLRMRQLTPTRSCPAASTSRRRRRG
jgi:hypothetical protein